MPFQNKTVLITGANNPKGIGAAMARAFAAQGARVCLGYFRLPPDRFGLSAQEAAQSIETGEGLYHHLRTLGAEQVVQEIIQAGGQARAFEVDLRQAEGPGTLFEWAVSQWGQVDVLINNAAAYLPDDSFSHANPETYREIFDVNVGATYGLMGQYIKHYKQAQLSSGAILNFSTDAAQCFVGSVLYGASKAAIEAMTRSAAVELGPLGIRVNTIAPGPVQSGYIPPEYANNPKDIPLGRIGQPEDIAQSALYLCSEQSAWVTGQILQVSGGHAPLR